MVGRARPEGRRSRAAGPVFITGISDIFELREQEVRDCGGRQSYFVADLSVAILAVIGERRTGRPRSSYGCSSVWSVWVRNPPDLGGDGVARRGHFQFCVFFGAGELREFRDEKRDWRQGNQISTNFNLSIWQWRGGGGKIRGEKEIATEARTLGETAGKGRGNLQRIHLRRQRNRPIRQINQPR